MALANEGTFHEGINMASIWKLPVIFVNENNSFAEATPQWYSSGSKTIAERAAAYGIPGVRVDGDDLFAVYEATGEAIERARKGEGPTLVECVTYRNYGHFEGDEQKYKNIDGEEKNRQDRDCIPEFIEKAIAKKLLTKKEAEEIAEKNQLLILRMPLNLLKKVQFHAQKHCMKMYSQTKQRKRREENMTRKITFMKAINEALEQSMERDDRVILLGEDIAGGAKVPHLEESNEDAWGGVFGVTKGLMPKFGRERVIDTPISEMGYMGAAVGAAATGLRPVPELMFNDLLVFVLTQS